MLLLRYFIKKERGPKICMLYVGCGGRKFIINSRAPDIQSGGREFTVTGAENLRLSVLMLLLRYFIKKERGPKIYGRLVVTRAPGAEDLRLSVL